MECPFLGWSADKVFNLFYGAGIMKFVMNDPKNLRVDIGIGVWDEFFLWNKSRFSTVAA